MILFFLISGLKKIKPLPVIISVFILIVPFFSFSENLFQISKPEIEENSSVNLSEIEKNNIIHRMHNEIYNIFFHYSSGNAYKENMEKPDSENKIRIIKPVFSILLITESKKGGYFTETALTLSEKEKSVVMRYTGFGETPNEAFMKSVIKLSEMFRYRFYDFDSESGFYRILDIYQKEMILSCGKKDGFDKGDYLEILDSISGSPVGLIILTDSDENISYGRLLEYSSTKKNSDIDSQPAVGTRVRKINYLGLDTSVSAEFLFDENFSGTAFSLKIEYFRSLYVFHPFISAGIYNIESSMNNYDMNIFSAGIAMYRHNGKISLKSEAALAASFYRDSSSADFKGGTVKGGIEYSLTRHTALFAEAGFIHLFAENKDDPDIGGFLFGAGLSFKY